MTMHDNSAGVRLHRQSAPDLGLLLDVDGPIASPVTRTVAIPSILNDLVRLAAAGVPIAFVTGRSDEFIRHNVVAPLVAAGLDRALSEPGSRMFGVFEKGGAWAPITAAGLGEVTVDESVAFAPDVVLDVRDLVDRAYSDTMFFDETKRAMISVEQRRDVANDTYLAAQARFDDAVFDVVAGHGLGLSHESRVAPDAQGRVPFRIDSTIISTDIESVLLDKDRGARRAFDYFAELGPLPRRWRSVGDSRSDYKMSDYAHAEGFDAAHVDVRPSDGVLERPYPVIADHGALHDEAGALVLHQWVQELGLD